MASVDILLANRRRSPGNDDFKKMRDEVRARNLLLQCSMTLMRSEVAENTYRDLLPIF